MNITSTYSGFTVDEAQQCINLLGKEYSDLPYSLHLYGNVEELCYERDHKPDQASERYNYIIKRFENGSEKYPLGVCVQKSKRIKVFAFFKDPSVMTEDEFIVSKYKIAVSLFHEARHAWQNETGMSNGYTKVDIPDLGTERYTNDPLEIDANKFQREQVKKNIHKILEICKLPKLEEIQKIITNYTQGLLMIDEKISLDIQFSITILYHFLGKHNEYVNIAEINNLFNDHKETWMSLPNKTITHSVFEGRILRLLDQFVKQHILDDPGRTEDYFFDSDNAGQLTETLSKSIKELYEHLDISYIVSGETPQSKDELIELNMIGKVYLQFNSSTNQKAIILLDNETIGFIADELISKDILTI